MADSRPTHHSGVDKRKMADIELFSNTRIKKPVTDIAYFDVYRSAIGQLLQLGDRHEESKNVDRLRRYLAFFDDFGDDWCQFTRTNIAEYDARIDVIMDSLYYRITYIFRNALLLTSAVSLHFANVLAENPQTARKLFKKKTLRICSVGGGSASDIVAVVSVLEKLAENLDIRVTILDIDDRWRTVCLVVLRCLKHFRRATWKVDFVRSNLADQHLSPEAARAIRNADLVTMVKFISEFGGSDSEFNVALKNTIEAVSQDSLLFVLDVSDSDFIEACGGQTGEMEHWKLIYEEVCYLHTLDMEVIEKIIRTYQKHFSAFQVNSCLEIFVRIWQKKKISESKRTSDRQLRVRFRRNLDQYNLRETFLDRRSFRQWRNLFSEDMKRMDWSNGGIAMSSLKMMLLAAECRSELVESKLAMDALVEKLECEENLSEGNVNRCCGKKIVGQFSKEEWEEYLEHKFDFVITKEDVHKQTVLSLYNHISKTTSFN